MSEQRLATVEAKTAGIEKSFDRHTAAVEELARGVHAMAVKLEILPDHEKRLRSLEQTAAPDVEARIRSLEQQRYQLAGISCAAAFVMSNFGAISRVLGAGG